MIYKASSADLLLALLLMGAAVLLAPELHSGWRLLISLPALVIVPGYLTTLTLFPGRNDLSGVDRAVLSVGYSLITVPLIALFLSALPSGVTPQATAVSLGVWTTLLAAFAWARRRSRPAHATFLPALNSNGVKTGLLGLVSSVLIIVGLGALISQVRTDGPSTEFYLLGAQGKLGDYPTRFEVGRPIVLTLAIHNFESQATPYRIKPSLCSGVVRVPSLRPGQQWRTGWKCVPRSGGPAQTLRFDLYRGNEDIPYRTLELRSPAQTAPPPVISALDAPSDTQPAMPGLTPPLDRGRQLARSFYSGQLDQVWAAFLPAVKAQWGSFAAFQAYRAEGAQAYGAEKSVLKEQVTQNGGVTYYTRTARFERGPSGGWTLVLGLDAQGKVREFGVVGAGLLPETQPTPMQ